MQDFDHGFRITFDRWSDDKGRESGDTSGTYTLRFKLYDDDGTHYYSGTAFGWSEAAAWDGVERAWMWGMGWAGATRADVLDITSGEWRTELA